MAILDPNKCRRCGINKEFSAVAGGMVHAGGGIYVQKCKDCDWSGSKFGSYIECPNCHGRNLIDDHALL